MPIPDVGFLQYGALGLLAVILVVGALWLQRVIDSKDKFIQQLAQRAIENQEAHAQSWREMTEKSLDAQGAMLQLIRNLEQGQEEIVRLLEIRGRGGKQ
jgi:hypothetical protein